MKNELCTLCANACGADRTLGAGKCGCTHEIKAAKAYLHPWEEPPLSKTKGSGAIFFSGCVMKCVYCQNKAISAEGRGIPISVRRLAEIFKRLEGEGADNIDLISPTQYALQILEALELYRPAIPVVYNTGGYDSVETLKRLEGAIDIYLPDFKYWDDALAFRLSRVKNYRAVAISAITEMIRQHNKPLFDTSGALRKGVIVRHLVLPSHSDDSMNILRYFNENFKSSALFSLMSQYTPIAGVPAEIDRKLKPIEYKRVLKYAQENEIKGFYQLPESADPEYIPSFDYYGL